MLALLPLLLTLAGSNALGRVPFPHPRAPEALHGADTPEPGGDADPAPASEYAELGFDGREIYAFADGLFGLVHGDWNGDGVLDLGMVNRSRARIELLVRLPDGAPDEPFATDNGARREASAINRVQYDGRYRRLDFPLERRVWRAAAGDFDGDGSDEFLFAGDGGRVSVISLEGDPNEPKLLCRREYDELREGTRWLSVDDLDDDGRGDILAMGEGELLAISSGMDDAHASLGEAEVLDYPGEALGGAHLVDLDGDGMRDLLTVHYERDRPFRFRLRQPDGAFGPRTDLDLAPIRGHSLGDFDGDGEQEIACILQVSGRVSCLEPAVLTDAPMLRHSLGNPNSEGARSFTIGDLDGDGTDDLVIADGERSRIELLLGRPGQIAPLRVDAPSLAGASSPRLGDIDGDGRADLLVISGPERMIGTSELNAQGELQFPETRAAEGEPAAGELYDVDGDGFDDAVVLSTSGEGRRKEYRLVTWRGSAEGLATQAEVQVLEGFERIPAALRVADLDRDGRADFVFLPAGGKLLPRFYFGTESGPVADARGEDAPGMGILEGAGLGRLEVGDFDDDGADDLLIATDGFVRGLWFQREAGSTDRWLPQVLGQWSAPGGSRIGAATAVDLDGDGQVELILQDAVSKRGLVLNSADGSTAGQFEASRLDLRRLAHGDLDGDGRPELVLFAEQQIGVVFGALSKPGGVPGDPGASAPTHLGLKELADYEADPPGFAHRLSAADFDGDGRAEIVSTELLENSLRLLSFDGHSGPNLSPRLFFRVFEEKTFGGGSNTREPRELTTADLTGDGRADIAVLVHNKLILYPQQ